MEEENGTHFLTMELVDGRSLDHAVTPGGLPIVRVIDLGIALADALVRRTNAASSIATSSPRT